MKLWHNGQFKDADAALFGFTDRIRLGDGVFDTLLVEDGTSQHATEHFARLIAHAGVLGIEPGQTQADFEATAAALISENKAMQGRLALNTLITRGAGQRGLLPPEAPALQTIMRLSPVPDEFPAIHAVIADTVRRNEGSPLSRIKSCNYGDNILALNEAVKRGGNEAIMLNNQGFVTCATAGNIFVLSAEDEYLTPPLSDGVMDGVQRAQIIAVKGAQERSLTLEDLHKAKAIFITNSIRGMQIITSLKE